MKVKVQYLGQEHEFELNSSDSLDSLKRLVSQTFSIPVEEQSITLDDRILANTTKQLLDLGLKDGSTLKVKRILKVTGMKENVMKSLFKSPMVKSMLEKPSTLDSIKEMFPDLKEELEENSGLNMFMNGGIEEEIEAFTSNEDYANVMLRNNDVVLSKLENTPEGMRLLSGITKGLNISFLGSAPKVKGEKLESMNKEALPGRCKSNPLIQFRKELLFLKNIGFENNSENLEALLSTNGDVEAATEMLNRRNK